MLLIYAEHITERLEYTLDFALRDRGVVYEITNDEQRFTAFSELKFNYSNLIFEKAANLDPAPILFDDTIQVYGIDKGIFEGEECLGLNGRMDPLAAIFYVLSRMEEYNSRILDKHGRFPSANSVLSRFHWLDRVVCDRWAEAFLRFLNNNGQQVEWTTVAFKPVPTFDIDNAYAFKLKRGLRHWLAVLKDVVKGRTNRIIEREQVIYGGHKDPYDTYDRIAELKEEGFDVKLFWLLGDYTKFDRNISHKNKKHRKLIKRMSAVARIGIHPSYKSNSYEFYLNAEKERLEEIIGEPVDHSRQHFLKVHLPYTYQHLETAEIRHEYSMGYPEHYGFRAGTARPFKWFDLEFNRTSQLVVHPFAYMDGTFLEYMHLEPEEAKQVAKKLVNEVKSYGGDFIFIWHNETIADYAKWKGWKEVFEYTLELSK
jgi:hypothetical protein